MQGQEQLRGGFRHTPLGKAIVKLWRGLTWPLRAWANLFKVERPQHVRAASYVAHEDQTAAWWRCANCGGHFEQPPPELGAPPHIPPHNWVCDSCKDKRRMNDELADYADGVNQLCEWLGVGFSAGWANDLLRKVADDREKLIAAQRRDIADEIKRLAKVYEVIETRANDDVREEKKAIGANGSGVSVGELCRLEARAEMAKGFRRRLEELAEPIMEPIPPADHFGDLLEGVFGMYRARVNAQGGMQ